jgi:hypothetical protein
MIELHSLNLKKCFSTYWNPKTFNKTNILKVGMENVVKMKYLSIVPNFADWKSPFSKCKKHSKIVKSTINNKLRSVQN